MKGLLYAIVMAIAVTILSSCTTDDNTVINEGDNGSKVEISVDSITPYGAIVSGEITGRQAEEKGFCWIEDSLSAPGKMPTIDDEFVVTEGIFSAKLSLKPGGKIFIVRAFALNDNGISYSSAVRVKTLGGKPGIEACVITPDVLSASVRMNLYNNYLPTKVVMTYGIDSICSFTVVITENVTVPAEYKIEIKGLKRNTQYFYKVSAINSGGEDNRHGYFTTGHGL